MPDLPAPNIPSPLILHSHDESLRVIFEWHQDRFIHRIVCGNSVLASIDGEADDPWPASPPLQQLSLEDLHGRETILGVGAAGRSHWSVSVQAIQVNSSDGHTSGLVFDWACRARDLPEFVGSTYQADNAFALAPGPGSRCERLGDGKWVVVPNAELMSGTIQWRYQIAPAILP